VTLPHEKFYDVEAYEAGCRRRAAAVGAKGDAVAGMGGAMTVLDAEHGHRKALDEARRKAEAERLALWREHMDPGRVQEIKRQQDLQLRAQYAFRAGNVKEAERLQALLRPDGAR